MSDAADPYLWLEEVDGARALDWVRGQTAHTRAALCDAAFDADAARIKAILQSDANIPYVSGRGGLLYNVWTDRTHKRGLWRRTSLASFKTDAPDWDVILDIDALGRAEAEDWVFGGATILWPANDRALLRLSRGGSDAAVNREFDMITRTFVADGFALPEAKGNLTWLDADTLLVATSHAAGPGTGPSAVMTTASGYARTIRRWRRGTPFEQAEVVFDVAASDVSAGVSVDRSVTPPLIGYSRAIDFFSSERWLEHPVHGRIRLDVPPDAWSDTRYGQLLLRLRNDWTIDGHTYPADALLAIELDRFVSGARDVTVLFEPGPRRILQGFSWAKGRLALDILDNVQCRPLIATPHAEGYWRWWLDLRARHRICRGCNDRDLSA